jgi:hypothetical protein
VLKAVEDCNNVTCFFDVRGGGKFTERQLMSDAHLEPAICVSKQVKIVSIFTNDSFQVNMSQCGVAFFELQ